MGNIPPHLKSYNEMTTSTKWVMKVLIFEHHIAMTPFIIDGSKSYGPIDAATTPRMPTSLSLLDDFLRDSKAHFLQLDGYGVYLTNGSHSIQLIDVGSIFIR